jgi:DNA polymerase-3 subunit delta'
MADQQILKPIENPFLHGHEEAENTLLSALSGGRMHHAWLITGPKGIGKATLAYRFARHLLSGAGGGNNGGGLDLLGEPDLGDMSMDSEDPFFHRVATGGHGDIKILSTDQKEGEDAPRTEIPVDEVREINHFLSLTPSESEWRVIVVDSADAMNRNAANALLKHLEEPPAHAIFLMVAHNPGKLLPTIRSRCRTLKLKPLDEENIEKVLEHQLALGSSQDMAFATLLAEGSPGRALELLRLEGRTLYAELLEILQTLPALDVGRVLKLAGSVGGKAN